MIQINERYYDFKFSPFGAEYAWHRRWRSIERSYIRVFGLVDLPTRLRAKLVSREVDRYRGNKLLDVGCGVGNYCFYFSRRTNIFVHGFDINESNIADCEDIKTRLKRRNVVFSVGNGHLALRKFDAESFDTVLAIEMLECLTDVPLALREIFRVMRPGAHFIGHVPALGYLRQSENILFDDENLPHFLRKAGFEILKFTPTFGGTIRRMCKLYEKIISHKTLVAISYPFLLMVSSAFQIESQDGDYRFFVTRKPVH